MYTVTLTPKEAYDKMLEHLLKQGRKSVALFTFEVNVQKEKCAYRGDNGLMCAFGCLIPDSEYSPDMEKQDLLNLIEHRMVSFENQFTKEVCRTGQVIHDGYSPDDGDWVTYINRRFEQLLEMVK